MLFFLVPLDQAAEHVQIVSLFVGEESLIQQFVDDRKVPFNSLSERMGRSGNVWIQSR